MTRTRALTLILAIVFLLVALALPASARTIVVDPAGGADATGINAAIALAADGDAVIVHSGTYHGTVHVDKRLTLTGTDTGSGRPVVDGEGDWGIEVTAGHCLVRGFSIRNCSVGILIEGIYDNTITGVTIADNSISDTTDESISVENCKGHRITGNTVSASQFGIHLMSNDNVVEGNTVSGMTASGIGVDGIGNAVTGNTVYNCHSVGVFVDGTANTVNANIVHDCGDGIMIISSTFNTIAYNAVNRCEDGLYLQDANDNTILGNTAHDNVNGLWLTRSKDNEISDNNLLNNSAPTCADSSLANNTLSGNMGIDNPAGAPPGSRSSPTAAAGNIDGVLLLFGLVAGIGVILLGCLFIGIILVLIVAGRTRKERKDK